MPYKDLDRKKEWERLHRPQRLARRRELRRIEAAQRASRPETPKVDHSGASFLFPLFAGGALAGLNPKLAMGVGALTLVIAAVYKKDSRWWIFGVVILALGAYLSWSDQNAEKRS